MEQAANVCSGAQGGGGGDSLGIVVEAEDAGAGLGLGVFAMALFTRAIATDMTGTATSTLATAGWFVIPNSTAPTIARIATDQPSHCPLAVSLLSSRRASDVPVIEAEDCASAIATMRWNTPGSRRS